MRPRTTAQSRTTRSIIGACPSSSPACRPTPAPSSVRSVALVASPGAASSATCAARSAVLDRPRRARPLVVHRSRRSHWSSPGSPTRSSPAATRPASTASSSSCSCCSSSRPIGSFLQTYLLGVVGERVVAQLRGELFGRLVTLSLDFHAGHRVGELVSRLSNDVTIVRTMLTQTVTSLLSSVIGLVGSVIILFTLSPSLLFIVLLLAPALIVVAVVFGRPLAAGQHPGAGHDRPEHDDGRGGAVGHPRRQELRPRGMGARALRRGPADRRRRPARAWRCGARRSGP